LGNGQPADQVRGIRIPIDIEMARAGGDEGEGLDGDVAMKVGQVHVAAAAALEQGSVPEERIGVEISDNESVVQRLDAGRRVIRRRVQELIVPGFDDGWDFKPRDHGKNEQDEDGAAKRLHGGKGTINNWREKSRPYN
jgi:hypothetical protein